MPASAREVSGCAQYNIHIHTFATRPLDSDNTYAKILVDQLRYHHLIPEDKPYVAQVFVRQFKVSKKIEEGTKIIIERKF